ncbi:hypothetical protein QYE76_022387 [Lolium multiflorum]|uniref:DUF3475 domain-containing protein n=1 Tax=Lolium multiflorum TaxID=4521 RepID=A0AAD8R9V0_LOLMU|nr:hypothetical protein QYE76_022387 [Lolium multiflorum]
MSRAASLWRGLGDDQMARLRGDGVRLEGPRRLVADDDAAFLARPLRRWRRLRGPLPRRRAPLRSLRRPACSPLPAGLAPPRAPPSTRAATPPPRRWTARHARWRLVAATGARRVTPHAPMSRLGPPATARACLRPPREARARPSDPAPPPPSPLAPPVWPWAHTAQLRSPLQLVRAPHLDVAAVPRPTAPAPRRRALCLCLDAVRVWIVHVADEQVQLVLHAYNGSAARLGNKNGTQTF